MDGEIAIGYEDHTELAARGDVFYSPPGHRFVSADGAAICRPAGLGREFGGEMLDRGRHRRGAAHLTC